MRVDEVVFFANGNTAVFDEDGAQIIRLQKSWFKMFLDFLKTQDVDVTKVKFVMPNGVRKE